jgi:glycerol-3-phosphate dehydrogenase
MAREEPVVSLADVDGGIEYSDAYLHDNDARFVWSFVRAALDHGCVAANYVASLAARREEDGWVVRCRDETTGRELDVRARVLVNACGPWVDELNQSAGAATAHRHVFSKGIHLIVRRLTPHKRVLTFFADDGRLFFVIPMGPRTCIGTTDTRVERPETHVTAEDRRFVLDNINKRLLLDRPLEESDVIAERCGVRPLVVRRGEGDEVDWLTLSRKHVVEADAATRRVSVFGGKLTDCLNVGEEVSALAASFGVALPYPRARWYGEPPPDVRAEFFHQARLMHLDTMTSASASEPLSTRLWRRYGAHAFPMLEEIRSDPRRAELVIEGAEYVRAELEHAARREMVVELDDFLRRRSKIALVIREQAIREAPGLHEACSILFGDRADEKLAAYFARPER